MVLGLELRERDELEDLEISGRILLKSDFEELFWKMRWAGHVARTGEERGCVGSWWGNRREGDH